MANLSESQKKSTFFGGAAILAASAIAVKIIGAIYRIPLGNILPDEVMGDYNKIGRASCRERV